MYKEQKPSYHKEGNEDLFRQLRLEANVIVTRLNASRRTGIIAKAISFPLFYFVVWGVALVLGADSFILFSCYGLMGLLLVLNYLNVIHDAVHHTIFKSRWLNEAFVYVFDLLGANSFIWKTRHVKYHHNYPNVDGWDTDIDQSTLVRITPHGQISRYHKYQHIYMPFLYPFFLFNWLLIRDFRDFFDSNRTVRRLSGIPTIEYVKLFAFKILFLLYLLVIPKIVLAISWTKIILAFVIMILTATFFALLVLLPPHANTASEFPLPGDNKKLPYSWFIHMLKTTNDVKGENWFTRVILGNYNYHIVHHLFPNIHHAFYPEITRVLKRMSKQYNLPYRSYQLITTLKDHFLLLKQNRSDFDVWEESM